MGHELARQQLIDKMVQAGARARHLVRQTDAPTLWEILNQCADCLEAATQEMMVAPLPPALVESSPGSLRDFFVEVYNWLNAGPRPEAARDGALLLRRALEWLGNLDREAERLRNRTATFITPTAEAGEAKVRASRRPFTRGGPGGEGGDDLSPFLLEKNIVPWEWGMREAPAEHRRIAEESHAEKVPTAFARRDGKWYVICTAGQGPMILAEEK